MITESASTRFDQAALSPIEIVSNGHVEQMFNVCITNPFRKHWVQVAMQRDLNSRLPSNNNLQFKEQYFLENLHEARQ